MPRSCRPRLRDGAMSQPRRALEAISQVPGQDDDARELHKAEEVFCAPLVARHQPPEALQPCEEAFDLPPATIPPDRAPVPLIVMPIAAVRRDRLDAAGRQPGRKLKAPIAGLAERRSIGQILPRHVRAHQPENAVQDVARTRHGRPRPSWRVRGFGTMGANRLHWASATSTGHIREDTVRPSLLGRFTLPSDCHLRDSF